MKDPEEVTTALIASGMMGFRGFWKISSLSKKLLSLRDDTTTLGLGSVCSEFSNESGRNEVWRFIDNCFRFDHVKSLQQLLALPGVSDRYPSLLLTQRVLEKYPNSMNCVGFLVEERTNAIARGEYQMSTEILSCERIAAMPSEPLKLMIDRDLIHPRSWIVVDTLACPVLCALIKGDKFEEANALLENGAKADVCAWRRPDPIVAQAAAVPKSELFPLCTLVHRLGSISREAETQVITAPHLIERREKGLSLFRHLAKVVEQTGCLEWKEKAQGAGVGGNGGDGDMGECTAMQLACNYRDAEMIGVLVDVQANCLEGGKGPVSDLPFLVLQSRHPSSSQLSRDSDCAAALKHLAELKRIDLNSITTGEWGETHTPLSLACSLGMVQSGMFLLDTGAVPNRVWKQQYRTVAGRRSRSVVVSASPLFQALTQFSEPLVPRLLEKGADPNEKVVYAWRACTLLQMVLDLPFRSHVGDATAIKFAKMLVNKGAQFGVDIAPPDAHTVFAPLAAPVNENTHLREVFTDVRGGRIDSAITELQNLIARGIDLNGIAPDGHSLLSLACHLGSRPLFDFLLQHGAAVGGGAGWWRGRQNPLVNAADNFPNPKLVSALLQNGADANAVGWRAGTDANRALTSPLQCVMDQIVGGGRQDILLQSMYKVAKLLIDKGAVCTPSRDPVPPTFLNAAENAGLQLPPFLKESHRVSQVSALEKAMQIGDSPLLQLVRESMAAGLTSNEEDARMVTVHLCDRANESQESVDQKGAVLRQWRLAEGFLKGVAGTQVFGHLSQVWPRCRRALARFGSGSWLADLIGQEAARGPILLQIIQSLPKEELEEIHIPATHHPSILPGSTTRRDGDFSPLVVAIRSLWDDGVNALLEKGVDVNRRNFHPNVYLQSPLCAALDLGKFELAQVLIERGAGLLFEESNRAETHKSRIRQIPIRKAAPNSPNWPPMPVRR
uniref:Uncharacterized protein n=1 Tax=Chromera velia CCMP2878 TaxID=1169474 RepID=A0A0G4HI42_9ALVE|eukprot:Cvel_6943.t1-p1 / transcript=Cvel_6943.t1 / gene=Cvel_6943 / organism=Chromera_velia_CCMP2878 / gene_product=hypothetical protein / transcript_product=hypothetical protein / location=Cvel_scaffold351:86024-89307(-) / protein_length=954 / sequence_SO=supercontig / SO=protein_coding / is_pseudo=false